MYSFVSGFFCWTLCSWGLAILSLRWMNSDHSVFSCVISSRCSFSESDLLLGIMVGVYAPWTFPLRNEGLPHPCSENAVSRKPWLTAPMGIALSLIGGACVKWLAWGFPLILTQHNVSVMVAPELPVASTEAPSETVLQPSFSSTQSCFLSFPSKSIPCSTSCLPISLS